MKRKLLSLIVAVMLLAISMTPALAYGSNNKRAATAKYSVCSIKSCTKTGVHTHNGKSYAAHYYGDGHTYHSYCKVKTCTISGYHSHSGTYCFGHTEDDGHSYHTYCTIENCTRTGYHSHNGTYCFAQTANGGQGYHCCQR